MKILIYQPRVYYFLGGGEIYPLQNAKFFSKLGHDVTLLTVRAPYLKQSEYFKKFIKENDKVKIEYLELDENFKDIYDIEAGIDWERWDKESLWVSRLAYQYLDKNDFDIITIHNVLDTLAVPFNKRHILHLHGTPDKMNYICKLILERENKFLAVSNKVANKWTELGVKGNIKISTNAIDENIFFPNPQLKDSNDLLFVGRLIPIKGVQYILKALSLLKDKHNLTPKLSIVGDGPYKEELLKLTHELNLEEQITFHGLVSQEDLIKLYQSAKLAVLPSYDKEGIMSTLLEAASCKVPSITTRGTSMEEFAKDNINALLVEPENEYDLSEKIYTMLTNKEYRENIAQNAYNAVMNDFTWLAKAKELIELYKEV